MMIKYITDVSMQNRIEKNKSFALKLCDETKQSWPFSTKTVPLHAKINWPSIKSPNFECTLIRTPNWWWSSNRCRYASCICYLLAQLICTLFSSSAQEDIFQGPKHKKKSSPTNSNWTWTKLVEFMVPNKQLILAKKN